MNATYVAVHIPLSRLCLCLDCSACFEVGETWCPGCSGSQFVLLSKFLDRVGPAGRDGESETGA